MSEQDWINAGLKQLRSSGIDAVRVEPLAETLGVTKGSFYWHFADRGALLAAMLEAWKARATAAVIRQVEDETALPEARLLALLSIVSAADGRLERAVRSWAAIDPSAEQAVQEIDGQRFDFVAGLFRAIGLGCAEASARARFACQAIIGQHVADDRLTAEQRVRERVEHILPLLVSKS